MCVLSKLMNQHLGMMILLNRNVLWQCSALNDCSALSKGWTLLVFFRPKHVIMLVLLHLYKFWCVLINMHVEFLLECLMLFVQTFYYVSFVVMINFDWFYMTISKVACLIFQRDACILFPTDFSNNCWCKCFKIVYDSWNFCLNVCMNTRFKSSDSLFVFVESSDDCANNGSSWSKHWCGDSWNRW